MMGSKQRAEATAAVKSVVQKAGGLVSVALAVAGAALIVALVALAVAVKRPGMAARLA